MSKKKTTGKFSVKKKKSNKGLVTVLLLAVILLAVLVALLMLRMPDEQSEIMDIEPYNATTTIALEADETTQPQMNLTEEQSTVNLGYGIYLTDVGSYTGAYMEDGSNEIVSGLLMLVVKNAGEQDIQYAEITVDIGEQQAAFTLTTLPVGESMVLLEKNRMTWDDTVDYTAILPMVQNIAYFQDTISTQAEKLKIQIIDGAINVTNISGEDIPGTITVYYKNAAADLLYGGITYRISIEGGIKAGEIRQVMTNHASDTGSRIMLTTIAE